MPFDPQIEHRPYPPPRSPWVVHMTWRRLLFMHWAVEPAAVRATVPAPLELDLYDDRAWIGVVPFLMDDTRPRGLPSVRALSRFPELNVRTYVRVDGRPGVWFWSLDCASRLAVRAARAGYSLPYFDARMRIDRAGDWTVYSSTRTHRGAPPAEFAARYAPVGPVFTSAPGSLDEFLTERYCLYTVDRRGRPWRGEVHHRRWPLQLAACEIERCDMTRQFGVTLPDGPGGGGPLLHYGERMHVVAWPPARA
jgi:uncharacterized protein